MQEIPLAPRANRPRELASALLAEAAPQERYGHVTKAVETWSHSASGLPTFDDHWWESERLVIQQLLEPLRSRLSDAQFARAWGIGQTVPTI